jgi:hypothetical protein
VVDVAHDGHHRRTRRGVGLDVRGVEEAFLDVGLGHAATVWPNSVATSSAVSVSSTSLILIITP